jgi:phosphosulfolactate phosphohydrolase-like enzyme
MTPPLPPTTCSRSVKTISANTSAKHPMASASANWELKKDIAFCLQVDLTTAIPVLQGEKLVNLV